MWKTKRLLKKGILINEHTFYGYNVITVGEEGFLDCDGTNGFLNAGVCPMIVVNK